MSTVAEYYDRFTEYQLGKGINQRHLSIQNWCEKFGLKPFHHVLEIGCGIGTQTELLAKFLSTDSKIKAIDISPKSIDIAERRLKNYRNISFLAVDFTEYDLEEEFDAIILPDVIEHIPLDRHKILFKKLEQCLKPEGIVVIHIPNPHYLEWCHIHKADQLQIIDQPILLNELLSNLQGTSFYVHFLETYSIWIDKCDYQAILLKKINPLADRNYNVIQFIPSISERVLKKIKRSIKALLKK